MQIFIAIIVAHTAVAVRGLRGATVLNTVYMVGGSKSMVTDMLMILMMRS